MAVATRFNETTLAGPQGLVGPIVAGPTVAGGPHPWLSQLGRYVTKHPTQIRPITIHHNGRGGRRLCVADEQKLCKTLIVFR